MTKKITVVIPVYNGASYLGRCIDSLLSQEGFEGTDLEIILIDDGSRMSQPALLISTRLKSPGSCGRFTKQTSVSQGPVTRE